MVQATKPPQTAKGSLATNDASTASTANGTLVAKELTEARVSELVDALRDVVLTARRKASVDAHDRSAIALLAELIELGPLRATDLAERACLDLSTVSRHLRTQEAAGYIVRSPDPGDGRAMLLSISDAGRTLVTETRQQHRDLLGAAIANWSDEDAAAFTRLARRLAQDMETV